MITDMELWDMNDSQRLKRGQLAPFNPNPRWPKGYFQGLGELGVKGLHHPFLLISTHFSRFSLPTGQKGSCQEMGGHILRCLSMGNLWMKGSKVKGQKLKGEA